MARAYFGVVLTSCALAICAVGAGGCSSAGFAPEGDIASLQDPIYGGTADTTHDAVMALLRFDRMSVGACSGTTIAKQAGSGILLTAAHCVLAIDANGQVVVPIQVEPPSTMYVFPGTDWQVSYQDSKSYSVAQITVHPQYDGRVENPYDLALVRYLGATDTTPLIPPLSVADDQLKTGSPFTLVGYGKTETNSNNSQRRKVDKVVSTLTALQISYDQTDGKGTCEGDSGGPALVQTPGGERVAAVTSYGDSNCTGSGVSVRVSAASSFIQGVLNTIPNALSCDECRVASLGPDDKCFAAWSPCASQTTACGKFTACANPCQDSACYDACVSKNPSGAEQSDALVACECTTACPQECANDPSCGTPSCGGLTVPGALCTSCIQQSCCQQATACGADAACGACFNHAGTQCDSNALYNGFLGCLSRCNANPCKVAAPASVPVDAGAAVDSGVAAGEAPAPAPPPDAAGAPIQYQLASSGAAASEGGCSCRQPRADVGDFGRGLKASCVLAIALTRIRWRRRAATKSPT